MRFVSTQSVSLQSGTHALLGRLGLGSLPHWLRGKRRQHHYRLQIRCEDRADLELVLGMVNHTLQPAGLRPLQSLRPGRHGGRELVLNLHCTPPQRRYLVQFVHQVGREHPARARAELIPRNRLRGRPCRPLSI